MGRPLLTRLLRYVIAQPGNKLVESELVGLIERGNESVGLLRIGREPRVVDGEKGIRGGESVRLLPSMKGWFWARLSQSPAASSIRLA